MSSNAHKLVHMTSLHPPLDPRIFFREALSARDAGYDVVVLAKSDKSFEYDGVRINAIPSSDNGLLGLFGTHFFVFRKAVEERADIYQFHDFELFIVAMLLRLIGKTVLYDAHEDLPRDIFNKPYIPRWMMWPVSKLVALIEFCVARLMSGIVAATPAIAARFPTAKTICIKNYPVIANFTCVGVSKDRQQQKSIYVGGLSEVRGMSSMVAAGKMLADREAYSLVLAGKFRPASMEAEVVQEGFVEYVGEVKPDQVPRLLAGADVGIVLLAPFRSYAEALPIKLFEYMAAGLPVIASKFGIMKQIVTNAGCGLLVEPEDVEGLRDAQAYIFDHPDEAEKMGARGREAVEKHYNWERQASKLTEFYERWP